MSVPVKLAQNRIRKRRNKETKTTLSDGDENNKQQQTENKQAASAFNALELICKTRLSRIILYSIQFFVYEFGSVFTFPDPLASLIVKVMKGIE